MISEDIVSAYCTYCKAKIINFDDIILGSHISCKKEVLQYNTDLLSHPRLDKLNQYERDAILQLQTLFLHENLLPTAFLVYSVIKNKVFSLQLDFSQFLDLSENNRVIISSIISKFPKLSKIRLNRIYDNKYLGEILNFDLKYVFNLDLSYNDLEALPKSIASLKNLFSLNLSHNNLKFISNDLFYLKRLLFLDLSNNVLENVSLDLTKLSRLKYLHLSENKLDFIDGNITKLHKLSFLDISKNKISILNLNIDSIVTLKASDNNIDKFYITSKSSEIKFLDCSKNLIRSLPENICSLSSLTTLNLSQNSILSIPKLPSSIKNLNLSNNKLKTIDENVITSLRNLNYINLENNNIDYLPVSLFHLPNIKMIRLAGNPISRNVLIKKYDFVFL